jgi:hypothetical protein
MSIIGMKTGGRWRFSTTTDKKFNQAKQIFAITGGFTDATGVLEDLCSAVCDHAGPLFFRMWLL